ncbi:MAG: efflux RND transporter periplasmic adaptor subunit [Gammaproteobacteria bacterium]|nr:MAG: efflux RND transporter periplasmic adaptor subunit [Gammaproteobacteria bacterium]
MRLAPPLLALFLAGGLVPGCGSRQEDAPPAPRRPPARVTTLRVAPVAYRPRLERGCRVESATRVRLRSPEAGIVKAVNADVGDRVRRGEVLVRLDERLLAAELDKARARRRQARLDLDRLEHLQDRRLVTEDARARARTALAQAQAEERLLELRLARLRIRAPFDGVVSAREVDPGEAVPGGAPLLTLIAPGDLRIRAELPAGRLPASLDGLAFAVRPARPGAAWTAARLESLGPEALPGSGLVPLRLRPAAPLPGLLPGVPCRLRVQLPPRRGLLVPIDALRRDAAGEYVFVVHGGRARRRAVRSGAVHGARIEILAGLHAGEQVVVRGFLGLRDGAAVTVTADPPIAPRRQRAGS